MPYFVDTKYDRAMKNERTKAVAIERSIFTLDRNVSAGVILKPSVSLDRILCTNSIKFSCNLANSNYSLPPLTRHRKGNENPVQLAGVKLARE